MRPLNISIPLETELGQEIFERLEGDIIENIIQEAKVECYENEYKNLLEGQSYRVTDKLTPDLYNLCSGVQTKLEFDEPIDFYISNSSEFQAMAIPRLEEEYSHIINLNSTLIEKLKAEELRFIIGHEIGHLISNSMRIRRLINFIFPDTSRIPLALDNKIRLWFQLSELTADRYGFMASPDLKTCVTSFFKSSSGLDIEKLNINIDAVLLENDKRIEYFQSGGSINHSTHPVNPIRVKALQLFSESALYKKVSAGATAEEPDEELEEKTKEILKIILNLNSSDLDYHRQHFVAAAGLIVASVDDKISEDEIDHVLSILSNYTIFPEIFLESLSKGGTVSEIFKESIKQIVSANPGEKTAMMNYLIGISLSNQEISEKEIEFLFHAGVDLLGLSRKETAQIMANEIRRSFMPNIF